MLTKKKVTLTILSVVGIMAGLVGCGNGKKVESGDVTLKVWVSAEEQDKVMSDIVDKFIAQEKIDHPKLNYTINIEALAEGDTRTELVKDPSEGADVFATTDDSCLALADAGQIYQIPQNSTYYTHITTLNGAGSVKGVTFGDGIYGFPETSDNGYFLYYNSSYLSDEDVTSFETILEKCAANNKTFYYDYTNGWYAVSYLNCNGGTLGYDENGTFCNWKDTALAPFKAMYKLAANSALVANSDNANITSAMQGETCIAAFTGTWMYDDLSKIDGMKCAELPYLNVDGQKLHMSSFSGGKVVVVNKVTKHPTQAMRFADFMTNEESQTTRFNNRGIGPSNINVAASEAVKSSPALAALAKQSQYSISQSAALNTKANSVFWDAAGGLGNHIKAQDLADEAALKSALDDIVDTIVAD
jgi:arabinogalactan oligomer/maltooligosaccharide transport system substrate-binding protein